MMLEFQDCLLLRSNTQLEEKVVDILKVIDVNITTNEIEACHCLGKKKKNVIVWVISRKHCLRTLQNKEKLKSIDKNSIAIPDGNLLTDENITPANIKLAFNCRKLKKDSKIEKCYICKIFRNSSQSMFLTTF